MGPPLRAFLDLRGEFGECAATFCAAAVENRCERFGCSKYASVIDGRLLQTPPAFLHVHAAFLLAQS
jgi:hypothetical protein